MAPLRLLCFHCQQVLQPKEGDGKEVCRFCTLHFSEKCIWCAKGMSHEVVVADR